MYRRVLPLLRGRSLGEVMETQLPKVDVRIYLVRFTLYCPTNAMRANRLPRWPSHDRCQHLHGIWNIRRNTPCHTATQWCTVWRACR
jgi:hypothetical protein